MRRCVAPAAGCRIRDVVRPRSSLQPITICPSIAELRRRVVGRTIADVQRVGKRVVLALEDERPGTGQYIVIEPRMTGLVLLNDPPDRKHLRLIFRLSGDGPPQIIFWDQRGLGVVRLLSHEQFLTRCGPDCLGPDALSISAETLRQRFEGSRRAIKVAMLDQHLLAGVGNLYASEILHLAHIHPATPCQQLGPEQWSSLHATMKKVLRAAIHHQGSTLRDGTYRIARGTSGNYQAYHRVYQRAGQPCLACRTGEIVRIVQAQRSTFFCPACQPP